MSVHHKAFRNCDPTLATASKSVDSKGATARLLEALSTNEGDSDLGLLAHAILHAGDYYVRNGDDAVNAENSCGDILCYAEAVSAASLDEIHATFGEYIR